MNDLTRLLLVANGNVATAAELAACGVDGHDVRGLVRRGELVRVRSGAFVDGAAFRRGNDVVRHGLIARAIVRRLPAHAVSHLSAVALWNLPVVAAHLEGVHVSGVRSGRARRSGRLVVHPPVSVDDVVRHDGVLLVSPTLAVLQTARQSMSAGIIAADAALRSGLTSRSRLLEEARQRSLGFAAHRVADLASPASESPGESWTRLVLAGLGFDAEEQVVLHDDAGRFVARVDFLLRREGVVIEFDGAVKYGGADGREALVREKRREDALRALGFRVVRLTWADLRRPEAILTLVRRAAAARDPESADA